MPVRRADARATGAAESTGMRPRAPLALAKSLLLERDTITYLIFFVTGRCNAKCELCFYWDNIVAADRKRELSIDEIERISRSFPNLPYLTLTGGEPVSPGRASPRSRTSSTATPGPSSSSFRPTASCPSGNRELVEAIVSRCPDAYLKIQLSIDGVGEEHDRQRGVPGNFEKMLEDLPRARRPPQLLP